MLWSRWSRFLLWFLIPLDFFKLLRTIPSAPAIIGITITIICHSTFSSLASFKYLSIFSFSFTAFGPPLRQNPWNVKFSIFSFLFLSFIILFIFFIFWGVGVMIMRYGHLAIIIWSDCLWESQRILSLIRFDKIHNMSSSLFFVFFFFLL